MLEKFVLIAKLQKIVQQRKAQVANVPVPPFTITFIGPRTRIDELAEQISPNWTDNRGRDHDAQTDIDTMQTRYKGKSLGEAIHVIDTFCQAYTNFNAQDFVIKDGKGYIVS